MMKKIFSVFLSAVLCFGVFSASVPIFASAAGAAVGAFFADWAKGKAADYAFDFAIKSFQDAQQKKYYALNTLRMFFANSGLAYDTVGEIIALLAIQGLTPEQYTYLKSLCGNISDFDDFYSAYAPLCQYLYITHNCYAAEICEYIFSDNGSESFDSNKNPIVSTEVLKEVLIAQNYLYTPKSGGLFKFGYRTKNSIAKIGSVMPFLRFYNRDYGFCEKGYTDLWYVPYLINYDGEMMLDRYQYHIYFDNWEPEDSDTVTDLNRYCLRVDIFSYVNGLGGVYDTTYVLDKVVDFEDFPFYYLYQISSFDYMSAVLYPTNDLSSYLQGDVSSSSFKQIRSGGVLKYYLSDFSDYITGGLGNSTFRDSYAPYFKSNYADNPSSVIDIGLLCSGSQIQFQYDFDIDRLPSNSTITISGDSVYDYSITDNSTGDTTTISEYVTNNYNYLVVDNGNSGNVGSGGKIDVGGKVEVGGKVDVGGKVNVDVNVNVNGNGGGGVVANPGDYIGDTSGVDMDIADYIALVPKTSKNFIDFMKDFFDWLPAPIFGLIVLGFILLVARIVLKR